MGRGSYSRIEISPEDYDGASVIGGLMLGGAISLVLWMAIIGIAIL